MIDVLINQTPCLVILAFVLVCFLKHLDKAEVRHQLLAQHCHEVQREATAMMHRTSEIVGQNSKVLQEVSTLLRRMNGERKEG